MIRSIIGAVLGAVLFVHSAVAEPTTEEWRAAARWSADMQEALQEMIGGFGQLDGYIITMEEVAYGEISAEEGSRQVGQITQAMQQDVAEYKATLLAMGPHPLPNESVGNAAVEVRQQLINQAQLLSDFINRLGDLSLQAIGGDEGATNALVGEIFRSGAFIIGTDIAMLQTQVAALDELSPLRALNLAQIAEMEFAQEIILHQAAALYGPAPNSHNGDLEVAAARLVTVREEISNGRKNTAAMRSALIIEKAQLGSTEPLYDDLIGMMDTFGQDWAEFEATLADAEETLKLMRSGDPAAKDAFNAYLDTSAALSQSIMTNQLNRSKVIAN